MRLRAGFSGACFTILLLAGGLPTAFSQQSAGTSAQAMSATPDVAVGPQYDRTHVYVAPEDFDRFVSSVLATFGGTTSKKVVTHVTPTPSSTFSQLILTPVGTISAFGFTVASFLCGFASTIEQMVVWRAIQGFLGAGMIPTVFASAYTVFPRSKFYIVGPIIGLVATLWAPRP